MTRLVFFSLRGSRPISTTFTSGVKPILLFTTFHRYTNPFQLGIILNESPERF